MQLLERGRVLGEIHSLKGYVELGELTLGGFTLRATRFGEHSDGHDASSVDSCWFCRGRAIA